MTALCGQRLLTANMQSSNEAPYQINSHNTRSKLVGQLCSIYNQTSSNKQNVLAKEERKQDTWKPKRFREGFQRRRTKSDLELYLDKVELDSATEQFCDGNIENKLNGSDCKISVSSTNGTFNNSSDTTPFLPHFINDVSSLYVDKIKQINNSMSGTQRIHSRCYNVSVSERCAQFENNSSYTIEGYHSELDSSSAVSSLHSSQCGTVTSEDYFDERNYLSSDSSSRPTTNDDYCVARQQKRRKRRLRSQSYGPRMKLYGNELITNANDLCFHYSASSSSTETLLNDHSKPTAVGDVINGGINVPLQQGVLPSNVSKPKNTTQVKQQQQHRLTRSVSATTGTCQKLSSHVSCQNHTVDKCNTLIKTPCLKNKLSSSCKRSNSVSTWLQRQSSNVDINSVCGTEERSTQLSENKKNHILTVEKSNGKASSAEIDSKRQALADINFVNLTKMDSVDELIKTYCSGVSDSEDSLLSATAFSKQQYRQRQQHQQEQSQQQQQQQQSQQHRRRVFRSQSFNTFGSTAKSYERQQQRFTSKATMALRESLPRYNNKLTTRVGETTNVQTSGTTSDECQYRLNERSTPTSTTVAFSQLKSCNSNTNDNDKSLVNVQEKKVNKLIVKNTEGEYSTCIKSAGIETATHQQSGATKDSSTTFKPNIIVLQTKKTTNESTTKGETNCVNTSSPKKQDDTNQQQKVILVNETDQHIHCGDHVRLQLSLNGDSNDTTLESSSTSSLSSSNCDNQINTSQLGHCDQTSSHSEVKHLQNSNKSVDIPDLSTSLDFSKYINYHPDITSAKTESIDYKTQLNCLNCKALATCMNQLKMDNSRLQKLLFDIEQARSGTVNALLHANSLLQNVQNDNTMLHGKVKVVEKERSYLEENLRNIKEKVNTDYIGEFGDSPDGCVAGITSRPEFDGSLKVIAENWKKEKKDLVKALNTTTVRSENAETDAERLRVQFKKIKEQLDQANEAYTTLLNSNTDLSTKFEEQFKCLTNEKNELLQQIEDGNIVGKDYEIQQQRMEELRLNLEETQDERDNLQRQVKSLEKQKREILLECDELHEQLDHSEDLMEKMTETEERLRAQLEREVSEKTYLQGCLDETGAILYRLRSNEKQLKEEKDLLEEDLETEIQQKQSLKQHLQKTARDHQDICAELEEMSNIHVTVKESLQQAGKKERTYQQQIEDLTKTNHILHYSLENEKEEANDLKVMYDCLDIELKQLKRESGKELKELRTRVDELTVYSEETAEKLKVAEKQCEELRNNLEQEEEDNDCLRKSNSRLEKLRSEQDNELSSLREKRNDLETEVLSIKRQAHDYKKSYDSEVEASENLQEKLTKSDDTLHKATKELNDLKELIHKREFEMEEVKARMKSKQKKIQEMDGDLTDATQAKIRCETRLRGFEKEIKELRNSVQEQTEELGTLRFENKRLSRERDSSDRENETVKSEFDYHKSKCSETMRNLRDEVISLQNRLMDKERITLKEREHMQDSIDSANTDLALLRHFMADEVSMSRSGQEHDLLRSDDEISLSDKEKFDLQYFKGVNEKYRKEMQAHVHNLEGMLELSKQRSDNVTVVQSPMSKIKLEEIKKLRDDIHQLAKETNSVRTKLRSAYEEIMIVKLSLEPVSDVVPSASDKAQLITRSVELERHLVNLDTSIYDIENQHKAVVKNNLHLLDKGTGMPHGGGAMSDYSAANSAVTGMREENLKLKTLLRMLKRKYKFEESDIWVESVRSIQNARVRPGAYSRSHTTATDSSGRNLSSDSECSTGGETGTDTTQLSSWRQRRRLREQSSLHNGDKPRDTVEARRLSHDEIMQRRLRRSNSSVNDREPNDTSTQPRHEDETDYDPPPGEFKRSRTLPTRYKSSTTNQ